MVYFMNNFIDKHNNENLDLQNIENNRNEESGSDSSLDDNDGWNNPDDYDSNRNEQTTSTTSVYDDYIFHTTIPGSFFDGIRL